MFVRAHPRETQEMVFDAHEQAGAALVMPSVSIEALNQH
jgi:hypothetical protein